MFSKLVRYASKPMTIALLITLVLRIPKLIDRYDGTFNPVFWISAIVSIAVMTLVTYAVYIVIDKAFKYAGSLLKRIPRGRHRR